MTVERGLEMPSLPTLPTQQSVERLRIAQEAAGIGIHEYDVVTGELFWDARVRELFGLGSRDVPTYARFMAALHPDDRAPTQAAVDRALDPAGSGHYSAEYRVTSQSDRQERWIAATGHVLFENGRAIRLIGTVQDISATKRAEAALRASEGRLRALFDQTLAGIAETDLSGRFVQVNPRYCEIVGRPASELYEMRMQEITHPDDLPHNLDLFQRAIAAGTPFVIEKRYVRPDGSVVWVSNSVSVVRGDDGEPAGIVAAALDITANKLAEGALRDSEAHFRSMADNAPTKLWVTDPAGRCIYLSRRWYQFTGTNEAEGLGLGWLDCVHPDDRERSASVFLDANARHVPFTIDYRVRRHDGEYRWAVDAGLPRFSRDGEFQGFVGSVTDVHERKLAEQAVRTSEERFRLAADAVNGIIYEYDPLTGRVERTRGLTEVVGYGVEEVPATAEWWWNQVHPDDRRHFGSSSSAHYPDRSTTEYRVRHKDGRWLHVEDRAVVIRDASGQPVRMIGCTVDVTDQKRAEDALRQADRKKDEFLATLAHELRNPLAPIGNAVHILMAKELSDPEVVWARALIERQVRVMARLLDDLLDVSRITSDKMDLLREPVELASVIAAAIETSRPLIDAAGHRLTVLLPEQPVLLDADPVRLAQVFGNLLNNAAKYTDAGGEVRLHAERCGDEVRIAVSDNGIGIATETLPRLFQLFAQAGPALERAQGGLGIGLALVRRIVELHGGTIEAYSAGPGRGSTFTLRLPVSSAAPAPSPVSAPRTHAFPPSPRDA